MKNKIPRSLGESGETQIGVILYALGFGVLCWVFFSLEACIREHKDGKVRSREVQHEAVQKARAQRGSTSYQIRVK